MTLNGVLSLVVDFEIRIHHFNFCGIVIDVLLNEAVDVLTIDSEYECVLGLRLIVNPHFCERIQVVQGNRKRKDRVIGTVSLLGCNYILSNCKFTEFRMRV